MSMELDNSFTVPVPPETAWDVLLDVARIAPCMPGATVDEVDGDVVTGRIKIKVGPVSLTYRGTAKFQDRDEAARTVLVEASGKETRGAGTAAATIKASLAPADGGATQVTMHTTMNITGRPAQFGRGVMVEVGGKLVDKFAENLAAQLAGDASGASTGESAAAASSPTTSAAAAATDSATAESAADAEQASDAAPASGATSAAESAVASAPVASAPSPATASATAPASATAAAPAPATASAPATAPAREDSINLVRLVGPAILKRVVPVAAIAAAAALLGRRIRRSVRRGAKD